MPKQDAPRKLDEIITENAVIWLRRRVAAARTMRKAYSIYSLAEEMSPHFPEEGRSDSHKKEVARIARTVSRYLGIGPDSKTCWRVDYLQAFCRALDLDPGAMLKPAPEADKEEAGQLAAAMIDAGWIALSGENGPKETA